MPFKKRKNKGQAASLLTRNHAIKKLQVSHDQFRKLCIMKGVFPRAIPAGAGKLRNKTAYLRKDIKFLMHDPILDTIRQRKIYRRRLTRRIRRHEPAAAESVRKTAPVLRLDHIIKERYPTFREALGGMDDALTLLSIVARHSPGSSIKRSKIEDAQRLVREWEAYVAETHAVTKAFISVRGFYFQAFVGGVNVTWIVPHNFSLVENDVDYKVISSFLDVYITLASFVNYKLYADKDFLYPPRVNTAKEKAGEYLAALALHKTNSLVPSIASAKSKSDSEKTALEIESEKRLADITEKMSSIAKSDKEAQKAAAATTAGMDVVNDEDGPDEEDEDMEEEEEEEEEEETKKEETTATTTTTAETEAAKKDKKKQQTSGLLFGKCKFYLGREVPHRPLELLIRSNGGEVAWDSPFAPYSREDATVTHEIMDRDSVVGRIAGRDYVQPQWVFDCVNEHILIPVDEYEPGKQPPPHLSPFVRESENDYTPERRQQLSRLHQFLDAQKKEEDNSAAAAANAPKAKLPYLDEEVALGIKKGADDDNDEEEEVDEDALDDDDKAELYEAELEAERKGLSAKEAKAFIAKEANKKIAEKKRMAEAEEKHEIISEKDRTIGMMTSKKRRKAIRDEKIKTKKQERAKKLTSKRNPEIDKMGLAKGQRTVPKNKSK